MEWPVLNSWITEQDTKQLQCSADCLSNIFQFFCQFLMFFSLSLYMWLFMFNCLSSCVHMGVLIYFFKWQSLFCPKKVPNKVHVTNILLYICKKCVCPAPALEHITLCMWFEWNWTWLRLGVYVKCNIILNTSTYTYHSFNGECLKHRKKVSCQCFSSLFVYTYTSPFGFFLKNAGNILQIPQLVQLVNYCLRANIFGQ